MRTHLEFRSMELLDSDGSDSPAGENIARLLEAHLPALGYPIKAVFPEDWGWCVQIIHQKFPLWIGCGHYTEYRDGILCFIEPSKPSVRRWLTHIPTSETVENLAGALESIVRASRKATDLRWWTEAEVR